jgi:hypothetical protein
MSSASIAGAFRTAYFALADGEQRLSETRVMALRIVRNGLQNYA